MVSSIISWARSSVLAVPPALARAPRVLGHDRAVGMDALPVERGLAEPALAGVELSLAREEPLAEEVLRPLQSPALHERVLVGDEHVPHLVGMAEEEDRVAAHPEADDVAVLLRRCGSGSRWGRGGWRRASRRRAAPRVREGARRSPQAPQPARTPSWRPTLVKAATARSMCSGRWAAESCTRMRDWPLRHHREEEALDVHPLLEEGAGEALGEGRVVGREAREHDGHDGVDAGSDLEAGRGHALPEESGVLLQPVAKLRARRRGAPGPAASPPPRPGPGSSRRDRDGCAGAAGRWSRVLPAVQPAERAAQGLAERGGDEVDAAGSEPVVLPGPAPGAAHEAGGVGVVDEDQGPVAIGQVADRGQGGDVAVHGEDPVGDDQPEARGPAASFSLASRSAMSACS